MSSTQIEQLIADAQAAFDYRPTQIESGLDIEDGALLQLRKACRLLAENSRRKPRPSGRG